MNTVVAADSEEDAPLTAEDLAEFKELEGAIESGIKSMEAVGRALIQIRDKKLYRAQFRTFAAYVETKWAIGVRRAYQLIEAENVISNLRVNNCSQLPENEAQARELAKLPPEDQPKTWAEVVRGGTPTAAAIAAKAKPRSQVIDIESEPVGESVPTGNPPPQFTPKRKVLIPALDALFSGDTKPAAAVDLTDHPLPSAEQIENGEAYHVARRLLELWRVADQDNRYAFLRTIITNRGIDVKRAIAAAVKKEAPERIQ